MSNKRIIALLSDFGSRDHYVGVMKGVILSRAPNVTIVDISHDIAPQDVHSASYILWASYQYFPKRTIFLTVVDPGVGSERKIICVQTDKYYFLAPDNGLLKFILGETDSPEVYAVDNRKYFLPDVSSTFHGRDIFASLCGHLANGISPARLGKKTHPDTKPEHFAIIEPLKTRAVHGEIIHIDHFGNLVTNFRLRGGNVLRGTIMLQAYSRRHRVRMIKTFVHNYAEGLGKSPFVLVGSNGLLEISVKNGSAKKCWA